MKNKSARFAAWLQAAFVVIGSVVGAGFISGGELVRFFPSSNYLPYVYVAGVLFFIYFALLLICGKKFGGFEGTVATVFKRLAPAVRAVFFACCFVISATMLAGIDSVFWQGFGIPKTIPVFSAAILVAVCFICRKGMNGIGKVNFVLVPCIILFVVALAFTKERGEYGFTVSDGPTGMALVMLYVSMNAFLAAPVICDLGKEAPALPVSLTASFFISLCAALILGIICREGANALKADMPLLYAVSGRGAALGKIFSLVCLFGIVTTLFSSYYPLHAALEKCKRRELFRILACLAALALARVGLKGIIDTVYPVLGAFGLIFGAFCAAKLWRAERKQALKKSKNGRIAR